MRRMRFRGWAAGLLAAALAALGLGVGLATARGAAGVPSPGAAVFASSGCGGCHTFAPAGATGKVGPSLDGLTLDLATVRTLISAGGPAMPSFAGRLTATQIADVAAYVLGPTVSKSTRPANARPSASTLTVRILDRTLTMSPARLTAGRTVLHVANHGSKAHALVVLRLSPSPRVVTSLGVIRPGKHLSRALRLITGSYLFTATRGSTTSRNLLAILRVRARPKSGTGASGSGATTTTRGGGTQTAGGAQVFTAAGCGGCHTLAAAGAAGTTGPNLDLLKPSASQVASVVASGGVTMPPFSGKLTAVQIQDVANYVASVAGSGGSGGPSEPYGLVLFQAGGCGSCHALAAAGATGTGGPNLDREQSSASEIVEAMKTGPDRMPNFNSLFTDAQMQKLASWIVSVATGGGGGEGD